MRRGGRPKRVRQLAEDSLLRPQSGWAEDSLRATMSGFLEAMAVLQPPCVREVVASLEAEIRRGR